MRYIAIFLVLANIAYFAWIQFGAEPVVLPEPPESRPLLNSGITLISEYQESLAAQPALRCFTAASFDSIDDANSFIAEMGDSAYAARLSFSGEPMDPQFRVYLPPASSRGIATITLDGLIEALEVAEMQVETYLITRGALENAVALGVFSVRANAENTLNAVRGLGYEPEIEEIPRSSGEIQVQLQMLEAELPEFPQWPELAVSRPDLSITENLCETIAQGSQFP